MTAKKKAASQPLTDQEALILGAVAGGVTSLIGANEGAAPRVAKLTVEITKAVLDAWKDR